MMIRQFISASYVSKAYPYDGNSTRIAKWCQAGVKSDTRLSRGIASRPAKVRRTSPG